MIVVTGGTGKLGRLIVERLLDRMPPARVGASVRDPAKAADLAARGVRVRRGDFAAPDTLGHAFEGAEVLLLVSSNAGATGGDPLAQHRAAIEAAAAAGVRRIVYTSHMGAGAASAFPPMRDHSATEAMLAGSGLAWTALRNGFYARSALDLMGPAFETGVLEAPADGPVAWTTHGDLAEATATLLVDGAPDGPTPPLTGREALDLDALARLAGEAGRPMRRMVVDAEAVRAGMAARGAPPTAVAAVLGLYAAARAGEFARVDPALEQLLGCPPVAMRAVLGERVREGRPGFGR